MRFVCTQAGPGVSSGCHPSHLHRPLFEDPPFGVAYCAGMVADASCCLVMAPYIPKNRGDFSYTSDVGSIIKIHITFIYISILPDFACFTESGFFVNISHWREIIEILSPEPKTFEF